VPAAGRNPAPARLAICFSARLLGLDSSISCRIACRLSLTEMTGSRNKRQQRAIENWKTDFARWLSFAKILVNR